MKTWNENIKNKCEFYRLSQNEYFNICDLLGRDPKGVEWALFSALWSEHCSYKSSKVHLRKFNFRNSSVVESEGENAGIIDLGQGEKVIFKMESHNHPSYIEPFHGAATGVGGILRDIFTMGARPIALADYLCFGEDSYPRMPYLKKEVVHGISSYGNCVGVPTVTGFTESFKSYNGNILVNAMAVGLIQGDEPIAFSKAQGVGNYVVYVGAKTGKDGVHGASMASESFSESIEKKKPNIQIGDPFFEKLLIESCLEVLKENLVIAMQDMGAAGLTSSSFEMAAKGEVGLTLHLDKVPLRDSSMTPEEILLSESQERMLLICKPENFKKLASVFEKWGLDAAIIGEVTNSKNVVLTWKNEEICSIHPNLLVNQAPRYDRPFEKPVSQNQKNLNKLEQIDLNHFVQKYLSDFSSKEWIYKQYDQQVGCRTARGCDFSIALLELPRSQRGLAISLGCRPSVMRLDTEIGAYDSVFFPALKMAAKGASAVGITDCLNFGNPEKEKIMGELVHSIECIARGAEVLNAPVISGNVSLYNETQGVNITSTPAIGMVGVRKNLEKIPSDHFEKENQDVYLIRLPMIESLHSVSETTQKDYFFKGKFDPVQVAEFIHFIKDFSESFETSLVVGGGGLPVALAKMSFKGTGFKGDAKYFNTLESLELVKENFYELIVSTKSGCKIKDEFIKLKNKYKKIDSVVLHSIGKTQNNLFEIPNFVSCTIAELSKEYSKSDQLYWGKE